MKEFVIFCLIYLTSVYSQESSEKRLMKDLLKDYNRFVRPVFNASQTLKVEFSLALYDVIPDKDKNQLDIIAWLYFQWKDSYLRWKPEEYEGLMIIRLPVKKIWTPDIVLYNSLWPSVSLADAMALIDYTGAVIWIAPKRLASSCKFQGEPWWGQGIQECGLKFGSWTYNGNNLDLVFAYTTESESEAYMYMSSYGGVTEVVSAKATRNVLYYPCCPEPYPDLKYIIKFKTPK